MSSSDVTYFKVSMSVKDTNCSDGRRAWVQLHVEYTNGSYDITPQHTTTSCGPYLVVNSSWNASRAIKRVAVMVGSYDVFLRGNWVDNPYT